MDSTVRLSKVLKGIVIGPLMDAQKPSYTILFVIDALSSEARSFCRGCPLSIGDGHQSERGNSLFDLPVLA